MTLVLASTSTIRRSLLIGAGVKVDCIAPRVDEENLRVSLEAEGARPREIADALADAKARKVAERFEEAIVIGCDQVLDLDGRVLAKPASLAEAETQLRALRARAHKLHTAAVVYDKGKPVWRHIGDARLTMRPFSDRFLSGYLARNADGLLETVGGYKLEEEGIRLFDRIEGDHFVILGLPLLEILAYLGLRGVIET